MIRVRIGNVLDSNAQTLVNTVNCIGVMGKGIALEFKRRFPDMYADYIARCGRDEVQLGKPYLYGNMLGQRILNFPTKGHWRSVSREADIVAGLDYLEEHYGDWGIESLAVPPLGCGNGGLEWRRVGPVLYQRLSKLACDVELFAPYGTPVEQLDSAFLSRPVAGGATGRGAPQRAEVPPAWLALVEIVHRVQRELYHWPVGRVIFQKIAYFATRQGIPTGLHYSRGSYGPFSKDLKGVENRLVNNNLLREVQRGRMITVEPGALFDEAAAARNDIQRWDAIIDRVADLFLRIPTTRQAELAATIAFATEELASGAEKPTEMAVLEAVRAWKKRSRQPFADGEIAEAIRNLAVLRWLNVAPSPNLPLPPDELDEPGPDATQLAVAL